jgi:glycosyltransferase involved in cell wall biosynthesis
MISVIILTKNEENNLPACLESVRWSDDVHVFDSFSTDKTVEIAEAFGATVTKRKFDNWSAHQNWGLQNLPFRHPWVLYIDADERVSPELQASIAKAIEDPRDQVAFRVERRDHFMGTWLKHVQATSSYIRLFRPEYVRYERLVNPVTLVDGVVGEISGHLNHFPFSKGLENWFERHNNYSTMEAKQVFEDRAIQRPCSLWKALFDKSPQERRYHQKEIFNRLPFRPTVHFLALYIAKRGFLDGVAGYHYARMRAIYESMIQIKLTDLKRLAAQAAPTVAPAAVPVRFAMMGAQRAHVSEAPAMAAAVAMPMGSLMTSVGSGFESSNQSSQSAPRTENPLASRPRVSRADIEAMIV